MSELQTKIANAETRMVHSYLEDFYISFNTLESPDPPVRTAENFSIPERCYDRARWFDDRYPFMAFALSNPRWIGSIFRRLSGARHTFPVIENHEGWNLHPLIQLKWERLESALKLVYESAFSIAPADVHPLDIQSYRSPITWGYTRYHKSEALARARILNSRNAFVPLMALCTYAIVVSHHRTRHVSLWNSILIQRESVDAEWVDQLRLSELCRDDVPRAGVYIDLETFTSTNLLSCFIEFGVPVWLKIPHSFNHVPNEAFLTQSSLRLVLSEYDKKQAEKYHLSETTHIVSPLPSMGQGGRQRPFEKYDIFFRRYEEARARSIMEESVTERIKRIDRERNASAYICPGKGVAVFEWVDVDGCLTRTRLVRSQIRDVWEKYATTQKQYNSFLNEWDLCRALDPNAEADDGDEVSILDDIVIPGSDENLADPSHSFTASQNLSDLVRAELEDTYGAVVSDGSTYQPTFDALEDVLYYKYGFHPDGSSYTAPSSVLHAIRAAKILTEDELHLRSESDETAILHFVSTLVSDVAHVPSSLYDLHEANANYLKSNKDDSISFVQYSHGDFGIVIQGQQIIVVPSASVVVEALRLYLPNYTASDLAIRFLLRGTRFKLVSEPPPNHDKPLAMSLDPRTGLGLRPHNYHPTRFDYLGYIKHRNLLLSDLAVARAALFRGGIIWRITVDAIDEVRGPVDFRQLLEMDLDEVEITQRSLGVIVGLYQVWSGMFTACCV